MYLHCSGPSRFPCTACRRAKGSVVQTRPCILQHATPALYIYSVVCRKLMSACMYPSFPVAVRHQHHRMPFGPPAPCSACTFAPEQQPTSEVVPQPVPRIYVGTQPAGLLCSDDFGTSWACCSLHEAPHADTWFRRLPPYEPCVRSITFAAGTSSSSSSSAGCSAGVNGQQQQPAQELVVAVEVSE